MNQYSDIVQFSRDLYLYDTDLFYAKKDIKGSLRPHGFIRSASDALDVFRDAFCERFGRLYKKCHLESLETEEQFFIYTISRGVKLVEDDHYYFSFMLVAAFIQELVLNLYFERNCYRFSGIAYKCLVAVFKRRFEDSFEENGGWKGLEAFINKYQDYYTQDRHSRLANYLTCGDYSHTRRVLQLIKDSAARDKCFSLNEYELSLIAMDDGLAFETEINESIAESGDSPLRTERDTEKDSEALDNSEINESVDSPLRNELDTEKDSEALDNTEINKSVAESGDSPLRTVQDTLKDSEALDNASKSITPKKNSGSTFSSKSSNSGSDSDSLWYPSGSESPESYTSSGSEKLSNSIECIKSKSNSNIKLDSEEALREGLSNCGLSSESSDSESTGSDTELIPVKRGPEWEAWALSSCPKVYGKTLSQRMCKWCNKTCYEYAKYFINKHIESSLKTKMRKRQVSAD